VALNEFFIDMYATVLQPGELLLEVEIPRLPADMNSAYLRVHRYQRPTLGVAAAARFNNGIVAEARLAVGCVGPKPQRLAELEIRIKGIPVREARKLFAEQKNYLRDLLRPVDDLLGSAEYKLYITAVMLGDALEQASQNNHSGH
jgi:carbon-monoxide dehydrogenase medium subunit